MDALPFIIERLLETPFQEFLFKIEPHDYNIDFIVHELVKVQRYMRWSDFEKQCEKNKQIFIKALRQTANEVGKFMGEIRSQYTAEKYSSTPQDHELHKTINELAKDWENIVDILASIVYCCCELKGDQTEKEFALEKVYGEDFEELNRILKVWGNITDLPDDKKRLDEQESLQVFLLKAFPDLTKYSESLQKIEKTLMGLSNELDDLPQLICKACHRSPLALFLLGSLLSLREKIYDVWKGVKEDLDKFNDHENRLLDNIINYCYEDLPYFLKPCFLYLSCYPEGEKIPSRSLINIWIAEGFISAEGKEETVEDTAYRYLEQLVKRSLVFVSERSFLGTIKYCLVYPVIHKFAINRSNREGFSVANPDRETIESLFRAAIHRNNSYHYGELEINQMHSFLAFDFEQNILRNAMFLKVLELRGSKVPDKTLPKMTCIRYLGLRDTSIETLPESIELMKNLQTLDVRNTKIKTLPQSLWKISALRHLYATPSPEIEGPPPTSNITDLQTLKTVVVPKSWKDECPQFLKSLRKLALSKPEGLDWKSVSDLISHMVGLLSLTIISEGSDSVPAEFVDTRAFPNLESVKSITLEGEWNCRNLFIDNVISHQTLPSLPYPSLV